MEASLLRANDIRPSGPVRYGAYACLTVPDPAARAALAAADVPALADRLGLVNEYSSAGDDPPASVAYLRRAAATPGQVADPGLAEAGAIVHVAATSPAPVTEFLAGLPRLIGRDARLRVLAGEVRLPGFTGQAMFNFAYGRRVLQQPAGSHRTRSSSRSARPPPGGTRTGWSVTPTSCPATTAAGAC